jgi:hypothetical protein
MTTTNQFGSRSILRMLAICLIAIIVVGGALTRTGSVKAHAATVIGTAQIAEPGATCLVGNPRYIEVHSPSLVAYDRPQYVEWWVQLIDSGTGKVVLGWTFVQGISVVPNAAANGVTIPGEVFLTVPGTNWVRARIGVNWFDPANHYAFEGQNILDVKYYRQQYTYAFDGLNTAC